MTKVQFNSKFHGVNCPEYRGAAYPAFDPASINESKFDDELRMKECFFDFIEAFTEGTGRQKDTVRVNWISQSWSSNVDALVNEIYRCFKYIGFVGYVGITIEDRAGNYEVYKEIEIAPTKKDSISIEETKKVAKDIHTQLASLIKQSGIRFTEKHEDLLERYVQCRIAMALKFGKITLS